MFYPKLENPYEQEMRVYEAQKCKRKKEGSFKELPELECRPEIMMPFGVDHLRSQTNGISKPKNGGSKEHTKRGERETLLRKEKKSRSFIIITEIKDIENKKGRGER